MFCTKCGKQLDDGMKFCTSCGAAIEMPPAKAEDIPEEAPEVQAGDVKAVSESDETKVIEPVEDAAEEHAAETTEGAVEEQADEGLEITPEVAAECAAEEPAKEFDLPDSALEPQTEAPAAAPASQAFAVDAPTQQMPAIEAKEDEGEDAPDAPAEPAPKKSKRNRIIAICSAAAVVVAAAIGVLVVVDPFNPNTPIDSEAFPNDVIRQAVVDQLDEDGDGRLSDEEAAKVTALVYTPEGAEFVTDGEQVDVQAVRENIQQKVSASNSDADSAEGDGSSAADATASEGASEGEGSGDASAAEDQASSGANTINDMQLFTNIKTLVAPDAGLDSIDLGSLPELEYVDLRGNENLNEIDLSGNSKISVLFCDEDTTLVGLEEAGLYYTDLLTTMQVSKKSQNETISVEYDTHARPIITTDSTNGSNNLSYEYDEEGRLARVIQTDANAGGWYDAYTYGANGLLSGVSSFWALDVSTATIEYAYGYDAEGRVSQFAIGKGDTSSTEKTFSDAAEFAYIDGKLASSKGTKVSTLFSFGEDGALAAACKDDGSTQTSVSCVYSDSGAMSAYDANAASLTGSVLSAANSTEYSEAGFPVSSTVPDGSSTMQVSYECNSDGYITGIKWGGSRAYMSGSTATLSYVKRVGSLEDRAAERYVPVVRPGLVTPLLYSDRGWFYLQDWFATTDTELPITMRVREPINAVNEQLGLAVNMLDCPNELSLAEYDREHWKDGLSLSGDQPIEAAGVTELVEAASQKALPVPAQTFLNDPVYGSVVQEYLSAINDCNTMSTSSLSDYLEKYTDIPKAVQIVMGMNAAYSKDKQSVVDFAYVDLDSNGENELVVTFPNSLKYPYENADGSEGDAVQAVYGQVDGKPLLIANAAERMGCWLTPENTIVTYSGAAMYGYVTVYTWDGSQAVKIGGFEYLHNYGDAGNPTSEITVTEKDGSEKKSTVSPEAANQKLDEVFKENPHERLNWTPIAV